jgi:hypothetical protein
VKVPFIDVSVLLSNTQLMFVPSGSTPGMPHVWPATHQMSWHTPCPWPRSVGLKNMHVELFHTVLRDTQSHHRTSIAYPNDESCCSRAREKPMMNRSDGRDTQYSGYQSQQLYCYRRSCERCSRQFLPYESTSFLSIRVYGTY